MEKNKTQTQIPEEEKEEKKEKKSKVGIIIAIIIILILLLGLVVSVYLVGNRTRFIGSAYNPGSSSTEVDLENSYVFASPLRASVGGEQIRLTVFILDAQGKGMAGRKVNVGQGDNISVSKIAPTTNEVGMAVFDVSSKAVGVYAMEATVDGVLLPNRVSITFE